METKFQLCDEMLLTDKSVFKDENEHAYRVLCYDGMAVAQPTDRELQLNPKAPKKLFLVYRPIECMTALEKAVCLEYRGIKYTNENECGFVDVCICMGRIVSNEVVAECVRQFMTD